MSIQPTPLTSIPRPVPAHGDRRTRIAQRVGVIVVLFALGCQPTNDNTSQNQVSTPAASTDDHVASPESESPRTSATSPATASQTQDSNDAPSPTDAPTASAAESPVDQRWPLFRGDVHATGAVTGTLGASMELAWQYRLEKGGFIGAPVIGAGRIFAVDMDGQALALDVETGEVQWETKLEAFIDASPALFEDRLIVGDLDGFLFCLNAKDGQEVWKLDLKTSFITSVNFDEQHVIAVGETGDVFRIRPDDGDVEWSFPTEDRILSSPSIIDGHCFLTGCNSRLYAIPLAEPKIEKSHELTSPTGVTAALVGDLAYFSESGGNVICINWKTGEEVWTYPLTQGGEEVKSCPAVNDDTVVIGGGSNRKIVALDRKTGKERWTFTTRRMLNSSPIIVGDAVACGGHDGRLYVLDLKSGEKRFEYECGGILSMSPAFANGRLVVSTDQGAIYCFRPLPTMP